jgi:hypothetical protein
MLVYKFLHSLTLPAFRDSIIPAGGRADDVSYNSVGAESRECLLTVAGQEEALYTNTDKYYNLALADVGEGAGLACKKTVVPKPKLRSVIPPKPEGVIPSRMSGELMESEDYMNEVPEGVFHTYSNHKELLEQLQAGNSPVPEPVTESVALLGGEKKISVMFKSLISRYDVHIHLMAYVPVPILVSVVCVVGFLTKDSSHASIKLHKYVL